MSIKLSGENEPKKMTFTLFGVNFRVNEEYPYQADDGKIQLVPPGMKIEAVKGGIQVPARVVLALVKMVDGEPTLKTFLEDLARAEINPYEEL